MGSLFGKKPKPVQPPPLPPPPAIPEVGEEAGDWASRLARRKRGFLSTIRAGALEPRTAKKTQLG